MTNTNSKQELLDMIIEAASEQGEPLRMADCTEHRRGQENDYRPVTHIKSIFGTWGNACNKAGVTYGRDTYTKEDIISSLKKAANDIGEPITGKEYAEWRQNTNKAHPSRTRIAQSDLGTFLQACRKLQIETTVKAPVGGYNKETTINALKQASEELGEPLYGREYDKWRKSNSTPLPSIESVITNHFNSWVDACETAGVKHGKNPDPKWRPKDLINAVKEAADELGYTHLTQAEYENWQQNVDGDYPSGAKFRDSEQGGISWSSACEQANIDYGQPIPESKKNKRSTSDVSIDKSVQVAAEEYGQPLSKLEYQQWRSNPSVDINPPTIETITNSGKYETWTKACLTNGITPGYKSVLNGTVSTVEIIDSLREAYKSLNTEHLSKDKYKSWEENINASFPTVSTITSKFDSWETAITTAINNSK